MRYAVLTPTGLVCSVLVGGPEVQVEAEARGTAVEVPDDSNVVCGQTAWDGTAFVHVGGAPSLHHEWDGTAWSDTRDLDALLADQVATLADYRWQIETGGVTHNGTRFASDDRALSKYQGIASALALGGHTALTPVKWRSLDGWIETTYGAMTQVGAAVLAHQSDCFKAQEFVEASIPAADPLGIDVKAAFDAALAALNS